VRRPGHRHRAARTDAPLTPRQKQVLAGVTRGLENKQIATQLGVSEQAVKEHVSLLLHRFGVPNRAGLAEAGTTLSITGSAAIEPAWLQYLFSEAPVMIAMLRGPEHVVEVANAAFRRACADREIFGRRIRDVFPEISSEMLAAYDQVYERGEPMGRHEMAAKFLHGGVPVQGYGNFVFQPLRGEDGNVNGVMVFCTDVTEDVRARQDLAELAEEHLAVLDQIQSSVLVFNADGRLIKINDSGLALLGGSLLGTTAAERRARGARDAEGRPLEIDDFPSTRALRGESVELDVTFPREDGTWQPLHARATPLRRGDGNIRGAVLVLTRRR
jgi:PAS domain-containing protein